jgi:16S rRNA (uracil1498-N3)-methyltransferase
VSPDIDRRRRAASLVYVEDLENPRITEQDAHHLARVLRLRDGEEVIVADGDGSWRPCVLGSNGGSETVPRRGKPLEVTLAPNGPVVYEAAPLRPVVIGFAIQKGDRGDWTVQKLTEIGVDVIVPFISERSVVRLDEAEATARVERYRRIAREAGAQSRRVRLPRISPPCDLGRALQLTNGPIVFAEIGAPPLSDEVSALFIGPEGGWSQAELTRCDGRASLGGNVLRAETAAVVGAALLVAHAGAVTAG